MKRKIIYLLLVTSILSGCSKNSDSLATNTENNYSNVFASEEKEVENNTSDPLSTGAFINEGYSDDDIDNYTYDGKDVVINYDVENGGDNEAPVGYMFMIDGVPMPFKFECDNDTTDYDTFHMLNVKPGESKKLKICINPIIGKKGDKLSVYPIGIVFPNFVPDLEMVNFGNAYKVIGPIPATLKFKKDTKESAKLSDIKVKEDRISDEIKAFNEINKGTNEEADCIDEMPNIEIQNIDNKVSLSQKYLNITVYGGKNVENNIVIYVDNKPVTINGGDYIKFKRKKGKMYTIKVDLNEIGAKEKSVIYTSTGSRVKNETPVFSEPVVCTK